jgi:hypothetical protein
MTVPNLPRGLSGPLGGETLEFVHNNSTVSSKLATVKEHHLKLESTLQLDKHSALKTPHYNSDFPQLLTLI